jgi:hypothetical protein
VNRLALLVLLVACEQPRTQLMVGVVTDVKAPNVLDSAQLVVTRAKDGFVEQQVQWDISGVANMPFNLPGSYGIYSDGEEVQLDLVLTGLKNGSKVVDRRAVLNLVEGKTLFFRMGLTAGCIGKDDCLPTQTCVESVCRDVNTDARQFPTFKDDLVGQLTCNSGTAFIDTGTGAPLPFSADADQCPGNLCLEGTCLNPPVVEDGTRLVSGTQFKNFVQTSKSTNVPDDLNALMPQALVPHKDGTFATITGTGRPDGTFTITDVPRSEYFLKVGTNYYLTQASNFDLTQSIVGRPDQAVPASPATTGITLNVTGLQPWQTGDQLEAFAADANTWWFQIEQFVTMMVGQTQLANFTFTLQNALDTTGDGRLIKNDQFVVMQLHRATTADGIPFVTPARLFTPGAVTMTNGANTTLSGAFTPVTASNTLTATLRTTLFDSAIGWNGTNMTALNPRSVDIESVFPGLGNYGLNVLGQAGGPLHGQVSATADYMLAQIPHGADRTLSNISFAIPPLPGVWATIIDIRQSGFVPMQLPGTTGQPARINVGIFQSTLLGSEGAAFYAPLIGPVRAPTIDGRDMFVDQSVSNQPTFAWQAPDIGKPTQYLIRVSRLSVSAQNRTAVTFVANLFTSDTTLTFPPGILTVGERYAFQITALNTPNTEAPLRKRFPDAGCTVASGMMTVTMAAGGGGGGNFPDGGTGQSVDAGP